MQIHRYCAVCFTLLLWLGAGAAAQDSAKSANPITITLITSDVQVAADGTSTRMLHAEMRANNDAAATRLGQTSFPYDLQSQDVAVVDAHTLKADGKTLPVDASAIYDQMPPGQQALMVTGRRAKLIVFPQFAAGDTAVYTVKIITRKPNFEKQFFYGDLYPRTSAYDEVRETITAPKSFALYVESHEVDFSKKEDGTNVTYSWHYSAPKPLAEETPTLSPLDHTPRFFVSSFKDYGELGRAYAALSEPKRVVTPKIAALADQISKGESDPKTQARKLYEWVSANIRYVGIELGTGSFIPHDVDAIVDNGYGDCKDHDTLLQALLKAKGIDAQSILINGTSSYTVTDVPTFTTLNHVITFIPQFNLYLDSSAATAPFGILPMQEYGKPMVVASATAARLGKMPLLAPGLAKITVKTVAALDKDGQISGTTTTTASGPYAITLRYMGLGIQALGPAAATRLLTASGFNNPTGTVTQESPTGFTPDDTITGTFKASGWADMVSGKNSFFLPGGMRLFSLSGDGIMGPFDPGTMKPDEPTLCFSAEAMEDLSLKVPAGYTFTKTPDSVRVETPNLLFVAQWALAGDTLSVHREFTSKIDQPFCSGAIRTQSAGALKQISDSYNVNLSLSRKSGTPETIAVFDSALAHFNAGHYALAIADYDKVIALDPNDGSAYSNRGLSHERLDQFELALPDIDKAVALRPSDDTIIYNRGFVKGHLHRYAEAIPDFAKAISLNPNYTDAYEGRGTCYFETHQFALAIPDLDKTLEEKPGDFQALIYRANSKAGLQQYAPAIADYNAALTLSPSNFDALVNRAGAYIRSGQHALAIADYSKALAVKPDDPGNWEILGARGFCYLSTKQYALAISDFNKVIALKPDNANAYLYRGDAKTKLGKKAEGDRDIAQAVKLDPTLK